MDDSKTNVYVFAKKELALIFLFMLLIAMTSFVVGIKVGKEDAYKGAGISAEDKAKVETLESTAEEEADRIATEDKKTKIDKIDPVEEAHEQLKDRLDKQMKAAGVTKTKITKRPSEIEEEAQMLQNTLKQMVSTKNRAEKNPTIDSDAGKYTIQLGSYRSMREAREFAEGFRIRGYNPIINEVKIPAKGIWYRVSLGTFTSSSEAKAYVKEENTLFRGEDYFIVRLE